MKHIYICFLLAILPLLSCYAQESTNDYFKNRKEAFEMINKKNYKDAIPILEKLQQVNPNDFEVTYGLAISLLMRNIWSTGSEGGKGALLEAEKLLKRANEMRFNGKLSFNDDIQSAINLFNEYKEAFNSEFNKNYEKKKGYKPKFEIVSSFSEGLAVARFIDKVGFVDKDGNIVIKPQFDFANTFYDGLARVRHNRKEGFIDRSGNIAVDLMFESVQDFHEKLAAVQINGKWGYINKQGQITIAPRFDYARDFSDGLAAIRIDKEDKFKNNTWGYINKNGDIVIEPQYINAGDFDNGRARIYSYFEHFGWQEVFIDKNGNTISVGEKP